MSKHTKPTKLVISAVTKKKHTKPTGHSIEVMLPHELAVNWANTIGSRIEAIKSEIEASRYPTHAEAQPVPEPAIQPEAIA
jgi:hypothetical protein